MGFILSDIGSGLVIEVKVDGYSIVGKVVQGVVLFCEELDNVFEGGDFFL